MSKAYTVICNGTLITPTEGIPRDVVEAMGFGYLQPAQVPDYVRSRMRQQSGCTLGVLRNCVDVLPIHRPTRGHGDGLV